MRTPRNSLALSTGLQRPLTGSAIGTGALRGGRSVAVVVTVLAILMMVAL